MNFVYINKSFEAEKSLPIKDLTDIFFNLHKVGFEKTTRKYFIVMGRDLSFEVVKHKQVNYKEEHQAIKFGGISSEGLTFALLEKNLIYKITQSKAVPAVAFLALFNNNQYYWTHMLNKAIDRMVEHNEAENKNELNIRVYDWLKTGKISNCALTLCKTLLNRDDFEEQKLPNHPKNIEEFLHCCEFLEKFPEAKARLSKMKELNSQWYVIVENWDKIEIDYHLDKKNNTDNANDFLEQLTLDNLDLHHLEISHRHTVY